MDGKEAIPIGGTTLFAMIVTETTAMDIISQGKATLKRGMRANIDLELCDFDKPTVETARRAVRTPQRGTLLLLGAAQRFEQVSDIPCGTDPFTSIIDVLFLFDARLLPNEKS